MDEIDYKKNIIGLLYILDDNTEDFIHRDYLKEKLNAILNGGINFHPTIKALLEKVK